jgi:polar amino acid transport system substrate-binding protein
VTIFKILNSTLLAASFFSTYANAEELPLRFLSSGFPLKPGAAIEPEFEHALAKELGRKAAHVDLPRKRMEFSNTQTQVDLVCFIQPTWFGESAQFYEWTKTPLMNIDYILIGDKATLLVKEFKDIKGKRLGTIMGYRYQTLQQHFDTGFALREDAPTLESSLEKQLLKRSDYTVIRSLVFHYLKKTNPKYSNLIASPLLISNEPVFCGRMKTSKLAQKDLEAAIESLKKRGELKKILAKYQ